MVAQHEQCLAHHIDRNWLCLSEFLLLLVTAIRRRLLSRFRYRTVSGNRLWFESQLSLDGADQDRPVPLSGSWVLIVGDTIVQRCAT